MSNGRAAKGGQTGRNGERYEGGQFLPSTELPKQSKARKPAAPRRQQISRYEWADTPSATARSIFTLIVGAQAQERGGVMSRFEPGIRAYGETVRGLDVNDLIAKWNGGERWVEV